MTITPKDESYHQAIVSLIASCADTLLQDMLAAAEIEESGQSEEQDLVALQYARLAQMFVTMGLYMHYKFENTPKSDACPEAARAANKKLHTYLEKKFNEIEDEAEKQKTYAVLGRESLN